jgi:tRNA G18 (ribose-2'-O)-methylase SpoU
VYLILHNIRSAENVGSMFRSADAFGVSKIYLTGYTPTPVDKFKRPVSKIAKTALGAEQSVQWEQVADVSQCINTVKQSGMCVIALEQDARATPLAAYAVTRPWALVVGNEVTGVDPETLALCDDIVEIPMAGRKESLNVAVAAGVALYALTMH